MFESARLICTSPPTSPDALAISPRLAPVGSLSDKDAAAVLSLRELVENARGEWDDTLRTEAEAHMDDFTLLRFVRSRPEGAAKAFEMFRTAMAYRAENAVNSLFHELHPLATPSRRHAAARACYFGGPAGVDREGRPYFLARLGSADLAGFAREPEAMELLTQANAANLETIFRVARACSAATGQLERVLMVLDVNDFSLGMLRHIGIGRAMLQVGPNVFPEGVSKVMIANAPRIFAAAWAFAKTILPQRTVDKVSILSSAETAAALLERIDAAQLPSSLGGELADSELLVARAEPIPVGGWRFDQPASESPSPS